MFVNKYVNRNEDMRHNPQLLEPTRNRAYNKHIHKE